MEGLAVGHRGPGEQAGMPLHTVQANQPGASCYLSLSTPSRRRLLLTKLSSDTCRGPEAVCFRLHWDIAYFLLPS